MILFQFISQTVLPPAENISQDLRHLAGNIASLVVQQSPHFRTTLVTEVMDGVLPALRLLSPFGGVTGLAAKPAGQTQPLLCLLVRILARQHNQPLLYAQILQSALEHPTLLEEFPKLGNVPGPNDNVLWDTHARVLNAPSYDLVASDLQTGLVELLSRTEWQHSRRAAKTLDARLAGLFRILPELAREPFAQAYVCERDTACGYLLWRVARQLHHLQRGVLLNHRTRDSYFIETCRVLNHPGWAKTRLLESKLGMGLGARRTEHALMNEDDDLLEGTRTPDGFRVSTMEKSDAFNSVSTSCWVKGSTSASWKAGAWIDLIGLGIVNSRLSQVKKLESVM